MDSDNADTLREDGDTDAEGHTSSGSSGGKKRTRFRVGRRKKRMADIEMAVRDADQSQPCRKASSVAHVLCVAIFGFDSGHSESH